MSASSQAPFPTPNAVPMLEEEKKLLTTALEAARQSLFQHGELYPQVLLQNEKSELAIIIGEPFCGEETKDRFAMMTRIMSLKHRAKALVYISEAWAFDTEAPGADLEDFEKWRKEREPGYSFNDYPGVGVAEEVIIMFESHTGIGQMAARIHRAPDNTPYITEEFRRNTYFTHEQLTEYGKPIVSGRFTNLLAPRHVWDNPNTDAMVAIAEKIFAGYIHDQDSDVVKKLQEEEDKIDRSIPRDLQN